MFSGIGNRSGRSRVANETTQTASIESQVSTIIQRTRRWLRAVDPKRITANR